MTITTAAPAPQFQLDDVVVFHGDKAGHITATGPQGPYTVLSDDPRDLPYTFFRLTAEEMAIVVPAACPCWSAYCSNH